MPVTGPVFADAGAQPANAAPPQTPNASAFDAVVFKGLGRHAPDAAGPAYTIVASPPLAADRMIESYDEGTLWGAYWGVRHERNIIRNRDPEVVSYLIGGDRKDELVGGPKRDSLFGGPGNDLLYGGKGNDTLCMSIPADKADKKSFEQFTRFVRLDAVPDAQTASSNLPYLEFANGGEGDDRYLIVPDGTPDVPNFVIVDDIQGNDRYEIASTMHARIADVSGNDTLVIGGDEVTFHRLDDPEDQGSLLIKTTYGSVIIDGFFGPGAIETITHWQDDRIWIEKAWDILFGNQTAVDPVNLTPQDVRAQLAD